MKIDYSRLHCSSRAKKLVCSEFDVQITIQRALEKYPGYKPRIISDNGSQFIS